ncbi:MAG: FAD-dependent oxidoreductase [Myxococcales bacterium]|nr:FAD-dependent oxidoreductase [Myxococcales bacterium]
MATARRLDPLPNTPFQYGPKVDFTFEGKPFSGFAGEPLALSLLAGGVRVFGRSIKYHRPRAPMCLHAHCSSCLMRVNGRPNVRTCDTPCVAGLSVERQTGWPGAGFDLLRAIDVVYPEELRHHELFTSSSALSRMATPYVRRMSGAGELPSGPPPLAFPVERQSVRVVVIGAGPAGLSAARRLSQSGEKAVLFEADALAGGRLLDGATRIEGDGDSTGWQRWKAWSDPATLPGIELLCRMPVVAIYPGRPPTVVAVGEDRARIVQPQRVILCTGSYDQLPLFGNNDLPGVMTPRALDRMVLGHGVLPAEPVALVGDSDETLRLSARLLERGVALAGVVTRRRDGPLVGALQDKKVPLVFDREVARARGGRWIHELELSPQRQREPDRLLDCALCVAEAPAAPAFELGHHAGCRVFFGSQGGYRIAIDDTGRTSRDDIFAAGHCAGAADVTTAIRAGERAAATCLESLAHTP